MAISQPSGLIHYLRNLVFDQAEGTDGQLLTGFIERRDEVAFDALVRRHGPMVLGVCQRILGNEHDSEDAFQATFLVLVRKATSVMPREMVGSWLHGVAHNTALKARAVSMKRRGRERQMMEIPESGPEPQRRDVWDDLKPLLDQELSRLPDKYRVPVVLCDLEGKSHNDAARQLGWPVGTLSGRLSRARTLLAKRLARNGLVLSVGSLAAALSQNAASACLKTSLASSTVKAAMLYLAGQAVITTVVSPKVAALVEGVLKAMLMNKLKLLAAVLVTLSFVTAGGGFVTYRSIRAERSETLDVQANKPTNQNMSEEEKAKQEMEVAEHRLKAAQALYEQQREAYVRFTVSLAGKESKVRLLQKERLAILKEIAADKKSLVEQGRTVPQDMLQAKLAVLKAELELCESDSARVPVHEKIVANAKELEGYIDKLHKGGRVPSTELLEAKAHRLEAEIELERAKAKVAPKAK